MGKEYVIDKTYTFYAVGDGLHDIVDLHVQCDHDEVMKLRKRFVADKDDEIDVSSRFKDLLDKTKAQSLAESFYEAGEPPYGYEDNYDDEEEDEDENDEVVESDSDAYDPKTYELEDYYDMAYDYLGTNYFYYEWSPEFKRDCIDYYSAHNYSE